MSSKPTGLELHSSPRRVRRACVCSGAARLAGKSAAGGWLPGVRCAASRPTLVSGSGQVAVSSPGARRQCSGPCPELYQSSNVGCNVI